MARPKIKQPRNCRPCVRFTSDERAGIDARAAQVGLTFSDYIRSMALTGRVVVHKHKTLSPALLLELKRIGNNLNQIAHHANLHDDLPRDWPDAVTDFRALMDRLTQDL